MPGDLEVRRAASHRGHRYIQWVLRGGLAVSSLLLLVGVVLAIGSGERVSGAIHLHSILVEGTIADRLISCGLLLLALTPGARVFALVVIWAYERDRRFTIVGCLVMVVLAVAMWFGHG